MAVRTASEILGTIQMILAQRLAGELNDHQAIEMITEILDTPDAVALMLDMVPEDAPEPDGREQP